LPDYFTSFPLLPEENSKSQEANKLKEKNGRFPDHFLRLPLLPFPLLFIWDLELEIWCLFTKKNSAN
jgi:hypothetical protein